MLRLGLTGGIASGKSTAARIFARLGASVFDADRIVGDLYAPGQPGYRAVKRLFGPEFAAPRVGVDKARLSREVFGNPRSRKKLEDAIHPLVVREIRRRFRAAERKGARVAVAEASQIFEGGYEKEFDAVILIAAPLSHRRERWTIRGRDPRDFSRRAAAQIPPGDARGRATHVLGNRGTPADLERSVRELWLRLTAAAGKTAPRSLRRSIRPSSPGRSSPATSRGDGASRRRELRER